MKPFEVAVNALSSRDAELLIAEKIGEFVIKKLDGSMSDFGKKLKGCLKNESSKNGKLTSSI